jgi:hypothetical protein
LAVKSVIDIEVNDASFKKFVESFKDYQDMLGKQPRNWQGLNSGIDKAVASLDKLVSSFQEMVDLTRERQKIGENVTTQTRGQTTHVERQAQVWKNLGRTIKDAAGHIVGMTRSLLSWGTLTGVLSGLLGAGGLFGISRLAQAAQGYRRSSLGLGATVGEQRAFTLSYGRMVNAGSVLGGVSEALSDPSKRGTLYPFIKEPELKGKDTGEVAVLLMQRMKEMLDKTDPSMIGAVHGSMNMGQFITPEEARAMRATPKAETDAYAKQYEALIKTLDLTKQQQKVWSDLATQLKISGEQIETLFVRKLTGWAPQLSSISDSLKSMFETMLNSKVLEGWIKDVEGALKTLAQYMKTDAFKTDVENFMNKVGEFVKGVGEMILAMGRFVTWVRSLPFFKEKLENKASPEVWPEDKSDLDKAREKRAAEIQEDMRKRGLNPDSDTPINEREQAPWSPFNKDATGFKEGFKQFFRDLFPHNRKEGEETPEGERSLFMELMRLLLKKSRDDEKTPAVMGPSTTGYHVQPFGDLMHQVRANISGGAGGGVGGWPGGGGAQVTNAVYRPPGVSNGSLANNEAVTEQFFRDNGFSDAAVAGLMANISAESGFDPQRVNKVGGDAGLMQWRGDRAKEFFRQYHHTVQEGKLQEQLDYALWELTQGPERAHGDILRRMTDPGRAGRYVSTDIERPHDPSGRVAGEREAEAVRRYRRYNVGGLKVEIHNNTGGAAAVKTAALPT